MQAVYISEEESVVPEIGDSTISKPFISWLCTPPRGAKRINEDVARGLGNYGYKHVWIREVLHHTPQAILISTGETATVLDRRIYVYAGPKPRQATVFGKVFYIKRGDGSARIMEDHERSVAGGRPFEFHSLPGQNMPIRNWRVVALPVDDAPSDNTPAGGDASAN